MPRLAWSFFVGACSSLAEPLAAVPTARGSQAGGQPAWIGHSTGETLRHALDLTGGSSPQRRTVPTALLLECVEGSGA